MVSDLLAAQESQASRALVETLPSHAMALSTSSASRTTSLPALCPTTTTPSLPGSAPPIPLRRWQPLARVPLVTSTTLTQWEPPQVKPSSTCTSAAVASMAKWLVGPPILPAPTRWNPSPITPLAQSTSSISTALKTDPRAEDLLSLLQPPCW